MLITKIYSTKWRDKHAVWIVSGLKLSEQLRQLSSKFKNKTSSRTTFLSYLGPSAFPVFWRLLFSVNAAWYVSVWIAKSHSISFCCRVALQNHFWFSAHCFQNVSFDITVFIFFFPSVYLSSEKLCFPHMNFNILLSQFSCPWLSVDDLSVFIAVSFLSKENYYCFDKLFNSLQIKKIVKLKLI